MNVNIVGIYESINKSPNVQISAFSGKRKDQHKIYNIEILMLSEDRWYV